MGFVYNQDSLLLRDVNYTIFEMELEYKYVHTILPLWIVKWLYQEGMEKGNSTARLFPSEDEKKMMGSF